MYSTSHQHMVVSGLMPIPDAPFCGSGSRPLLATDPGLTEGLAVAVGNLLFLSSCRERERERERERRESGIHTRALFPE